MNPLNPLRMFHENGKIKSTRYHAKGLTHRLGGPAFQSWFTSGLLAEELWAIDGLAHREGGPAHIEWSVDGQLVSEQWMQFGKRHRLDGPAFMYYRLSSPVEQWSIHGVILLRAEYSELASLPTLQMLVRLVHFPMSAGDREHILDLIRKEDPGISRNIEASLQLA